jgi:hypothetical protein
MLCQYSTRFGSDRVADSALAAERQGVGPTTELLTQQEQQYFPGHVCLKVLVRQEVTVVDITHSMTRPYLMSRLKCSIL